MDKFQIGNFQIERVQVDNFLIEKFEVRETPAPLNIPTPTPAADHHIPPVLLFLRPACFVALTMYKEIRIGYVAETIPCILPNGSGTTR